jgi:GntR family transcriptional regulator, carbon starvation induced regulator
MDATTRIEITRPHTLSEVAYQGIRQLILSGKVTPGEKLPLERLASQLGMGTTPLREALSRLAVEGLVIGHRQRGYWAASMSRTEYMDITDLRLDLEPKALALSIQKGDMQWEGRVVAAFHQLSRVTKRLADEPAAAAAEWETQNKAFHMTLIDSCANAWLLRFTAMLFEQSERYRHISIAARAIPPPASEQEHKDLMQASLDRNAQLAVGLLKEHIWRSANAAAKAIFTESGDQNTARPQWTSSG